jgi:4-hydroxymandelate oxidase
MYRTGPPPAAAGRGAGATGPHGALPRISRAERRVFDGFSQAAFDPVLRVFLADLVRPYGLALREDLLREGAGHSYGEMADPLVRAAVADGEPVDLVVLAFAIHDIRLGRATALYLSDACPGEPMAFAVCDQGNAAAFTALRLVGEFTRGGTCRRCLLVVVEQSTLHYRPAGPAPIPDRHAAVALLFDDSGPAGLGPARQHTAVPPGQVGALRAADVAELAGGREDVTLVLGAGLAGLGLPRLVDRVVSAPAGQPFTGPWWELAGGLPGWADRGGLVMLADHDPQLRYLCLSTMDFGLSRPAAARQAARSGRAAP